MINSYNFIHSLTEKGYTSFYGVPDSILSSFSKSLYFDFKHINHFITANEGSALAMSIGYQLTHDKVPIVYLQNSGLGNCINALTSLCIPHNIHPLLVIGHREGLPQHKVMGEVDEKMLQFIGYMDYIIV